jgi:hypothetical protein
MFPCNNILTRIFYSRGGEDKVARGGLKVPRFCADPEHRGIGGRYPRRVPWSGHTAGASDPQHGHHDEHLRGRGVRPDAVHGPPRRDTGHIRVLRPTRLQHGTGGTASTLALVHRHLTRGNHTQSSLKCTNLEF